jgi:hypothetical protein
VDSNPDWFRQSDPGRHFCPTKQEEKIARFQVLKRWMISVGGWKLLLWFGNPSLRSEMTMQFSNKKINLILSAKLSKFWSPETFKSVPVFGRKPRAVFLSVYFNRQLYETDFTHNLQ